MKKLFIFLILAGLTLSGMKAFSSSFPFALLKDLMGNISIGAITSMTQTNYHKKLTRVHDEYVLQGECEIAFEQIAIMDYKIKIDSSRLKREFEESNMGLIDNGMYFRGLCMEKRGDTISAKRIYTRLLSINPDFRPLISRKGKKEVFLSNVIKKESNHAGLFYRTRQDISRRR